MLIDAKLGVSILQLLFNIYNSYRDRSKKPSDGEPQETEVEAEPPNPERLKELIREVEERPKETEESISAAIDEKFPPEEAKRVKGDFATFALLVSPPNFGDYDFFGVIQRYARGIQTIALRTDLFRLRGWKNPRGVRLLPMRQTAAALVPSRVAGMPVYLFGEIIQGSVEKCDAFLFNEQADLPLIICLQAVFSYASYGGYSGQRRERGEKTYKLCEGQEANWLEFRRVETMDPPFAFKDFAYRLNASEAKAILTALKGDIADYLGEIEEERPVVDQLRQELEALWKVAPPETQS